MKVKQSTLNKVSKKIEELLEKSGQKGRYQITILILITFQLILTQFFNSGLFFLSSRPYIFINETKTINITNKDNISNIENIVKTKSILLTKKLCNELTNITIDKHKSGASILIDFEIYCNDYKSYLIIIIFYSGMLIGSFISHFFADRIGRRKSLLIIIPLHIVFLFSFELTNKDFYEDNYYNLGLIILYIFLFFLGICSSIIKIVLIIYICDIVKQNDIPLFIYFCFASNPISEILSSYIFTSLDIEWRHILSYNAMLSIISYIFFVILLLGSPMFYLNNEDYEKFVKNLMKISKFNKTSLKREDFLFLRPYMSLRQQKSFDEDLEEDNLSDKENGLFYNDIFIKGNLNTELIILNRSELKEDFLLEAHENEDKPYISLIGHIKMKDYSHLDLLKRGEIDIFLILSYLWTTATILRNGFNIYFINIPEYEDNFKYYAFLVCGEFFVMILSYQTLKRKLSIFLPLLITILLICFIVLCFNMYRNEKFGFYNIFQLYSIKITTDSLFLILYILTMLIYPVIIRALAFSGVLFFMHIGQILCLIFDDNININDISLYFLALIFFGITFSYNLPDKIGTLILSNPENEEQKKKDNDDSINEENNVKNTLNETSIEENKSRTEVVDKLELYNIN